MTKSALLFAIGAFVIGAAWSAPASAKPSRSERSVTLDVKDADVRDILRAMQQQCAVKNLLIDEDVTGAGTIYFRDVPCSTAFKVVLSQFGLAGQVEPNSVVTVRSRNAR